jgi:hypothetical protein
MEDEGRLPGGGLPDQPSNRSALLPALLGDKLPGGEQFGKRREELVRCVVPRQKIAIFLKIKLPTDPY